MREFAADVVVVGAGVAGLAAAVRLARAGNAVVVLEARADVGGRVATERPKGWPLPIELGAEFVHTGNAVLSRWLRRSGLKTRDIDEQQWHARDGRLELVPDGWDRMNAVMERIGPRFRGSFAQWLRTSGKSVSPLDRKLATAFVKGFQAAPPAKMSAATLYAASQEPEQQMRPAGGYRKLIDSLFAHAGKLGVRIETNAPVRRIIWRRGSAAVATARATWQARAVVITLPLGVLRAKRESAGAVAFVPRLTAKARCWKRMGSGHAIRVVLQMRSDAWKRGTIPAELRRDSGHGFGFLQSQETFFPVWWAEAPHPVLVGWTGGPAAARLATKTERQIVSVAITTLARLLGVRHQRLLAAIKGWRTHNWSADPYARGAYSYSVAGHEDAPAQLARPVRGTLFFAGEATGDPLELGTVHGALASGERAAAEAISALSRSRKE